MNVLSQPISCWPYDAVFISVRVSVTERRPWGVSTTRTTVLPGAPLRSIIAHVAPKSPTSRPSIDRTIMPGTNWARAAGESGNTLEIVGGLPGSRTEDPPRRYRNRHLAEVGEANKTAGSSAHFAPRERDCGSRPDTPGRREPGARSCARARDVRSRTHPRRRYAPRHANACGSFPRRSLGMGFPVSRSTMRPFNRRLAPRRTRRPSRDSPSRRGTAARRPTPPSTVVTRTSYFPASRPFTSKAPAGLLTARRCLPPCRRRGVPHQGSVPRRG